jgi:peptide/nickel transport system substrate-binding protein
LGAVIVALLTTTALAQTPRQVWQSSLVIATGDEPQTFDLHANVTAVGGRRFYPNIYEGLLGFAPDGKILPKLATSYDVSSDGLRYTFQLRPGVTFSDGTPFNAAAVKWNLERLRKLNKGPVGLYEPVNEIQTPNDRTVVFVMKRPYAPFLSMMAAWQGAIFMSPSMADARAQGGDSGGAWMHNHTAGTGPYVLESWQPDNQIVLVKNDRYREPWPAQAITRVVYRAVKEPATAMQMLIRGDLDVLEELTLPDFVDVLGRVSTLEVKVVDAIGGNNIHLWANLKKPPFDNPRVRQAISLALDYQRIVSNAFPKVGTVARGLYAESAKPWFDPNGKPRQQNMEAAKRLMREANVRTPIQASLGWQAGFRAQREMAQIIRENLAELGIQIEIVEQPITVWREAIWRNSFDLTFVQLGLRFPDPDAVVHLVFHSSNFRFGGFNPGVVSPQMDDLIEKGRSATTINDRVRVYRDIDRLVERETLTMPIVFFKFIYSQRAGVSNLTWNPYYGPHYEPFPVRKDPATFPGR